MMYYGMGRGQDEKPKFFSEITDLKARLQFIKKFQGHASPVLDLLMQLVVSVFDLSGKTHEEHLKFLAYLFIDVDTLLEEANANIGCNPGTPENGAPENDSCNRADGDKENDCVNENVGNNSSRSETCKGRSAKSNKYSPEKVMVGLVKNRMFRDCITTQIRTNLHVQRKLKYIASAFLPDVHEAGCLLLKANLSKQSYNVLYRTLGRTKRLVVSMKKIGRARVMKKRWLKDALKAFKTDQGS